MGKLNLPDVTLVMIETRQFELARMAIEDCLKHADFGDILTFTNKPGEFSAGRFVQVPDWPEKIGWSRCNWQEVAPHVQTSFALGIQWDSWIVDPTMWRDEFLAYDYIGAPWWYKDGLNVGNGGFCIRSTRLMRFLRKHRDLFPCTTNLDDDLLCRKYRTALEDKGFTWAPEKLAWDFAFETIRPKPDSRHFGFHAAYNFDYGCEGDEPRLRERALIMAKSKYMTKTNPYIWDGFRKKNPKLADEFARFKAEG
jgi:hypothetical protein